MYETLDCKVLRSGEKMEVGVVVGPDPEWYEALSGFLSHKGPDLLWQVQQALAVPLDRLGSYFYVGLLDRRIVTQVYVAVTGCCGFLGHVYTLPEHRGKGAYSALMEAQMRHSESLGVTLIQLGTGYDSVAYHIYHRFGFRSIWPQSGRMRWEKEPDAVAPHYAPGPAVIRPMRWEDWPWCSVLFTTEGSRLHSVAMDVFQPGWSKGGFIKLMRDEGAERLAAVKNDGVVVGIGSRTRDPKWRHPEIVDVYVHPRFVDQLDPLLVTLTARPGRLQSYVPVGDETRTDALLSHGLAQEAVLPAQCIIDGQPVDVALFGRKG